VIMKYEIRYVILGWETYLYSCFFIYMLCIAHPFCVCGDDWVTCYPGADDVTSGSGAT